MSAFLVVLRRYGGVVLASAVLVPHALYFDFISDDAFISFRYARNLAEHGELVFNLGERVEGYTNFLWTVLLAAGIKLGISPLLSARFLGVAFAVGTLAVAVRLSLRLDRERPSAWHLVAPLGLAATGAFACWATGGLETQLFTFLSFLALERMLAETEPGKSGYGSGALFALAALTRPEGVLFFAVAALYRLITNIVHERRFVPRRRDLAWAGLFVALFAPYVAWRWWYYGWPLPNTFYVKTSASAQVWAMGLYYLRRFVEDHGVVFLFGVLVLGWPARAHKARWNLGLLAALLSVVYALYVVRVGGDFMGLYRFDLPVLPLLAVAMQEALRTLSARLWPFVGQPALMLGGLALVGGFLAGSAKVTWHAANVVGADNGIDTPAYLRHYVEQRVPVARWLGQHAQPDDLMTVGGAGVIPYYAHRARAFDVFGLVDQTIAHEAAFTVSSRPGHTKWAPDSYMLSRRPTLVTHKYCLGGPCDYEHAADPGYEWVRVPIPGVYYSFQKRVDRAFGPFSTRSP
jgi:hypothetical protein